MTFRVPAALLLAGQLAAFVPATSGWLCRGSGETHESPCCDEAPPAATSVTGEPCCELTSADPAEPIPTVVPGLAPALSLPVGGVIVSNATLRPTTVATAALSPPATGPPIFVRTCTYLI